MRQGHLLIDGSEKETLSKIRKCTDLDDEEVIKALKNMKGEKKKNKEFNFNVFLTLLILVVMLVENASMMQNL